MTTFSFPVGSEDTTPTEDSPTPPTVYEWPIVYVTDRTNRACAKLISQYRDKPRIRAYLSAIVDELQELEDVQQDVMKINDFENKSGETLAQVARKVGVDPVGLSDDAIKLRIRVAILVNLSSGRHEDIIKIVRTMFGLVNGEYLITPEFPAAITVTLNELVDDDVTYAHGVIESAIDEGVALFLEYLSEEAEDSFMFADASTEQDDADRGFSDNDEDTGGGAWVGVVGS